jgi:membrane protease YdiL (CAAX protease family)
MGRLIDGERHPTRLTWWFVLVTLLAALAYASRVAGGKPPKNYLYTWGAVANGAVQYAVLLGFLAPIVIGLSRRELGLRRPRSWRAAFGWSIVAALAIVAITGIVAPFLHPGQEQGLTPSGWDANRAPQFAANFVVVALVAPIAEELTFRGAGYGLIAPYTRVGAIVAVGLAFALAHGLLDALPIFVVFGSALAWLRDRTGSIFPGLVIHACWNAITLLDAVHWFRA